VGCCPNVRSLWMRGLYQRVCERRACVSCWLTRSGLGTGKEEPYRSVSFYLAARTVSTSRRVPCIPNVRVGGGRLVPAVGFRFAPQRVGRLRKMWEAPSLQKNQF
jgi:hypothetical protein